MAKLFPFEKELKATLKYFDAKDVSYDFVEKLLITDPVDIISYSYSINNFKDNNVKYEFHRVDGKYYTLYRFIIGKRMYRGIIKTIDYTAVSALFNKFLEVNGVIKHNV